MLNDFEIMCKKLSKSNRYGDYNEITRTIENVKDFVGNDRDKLLKLKAEAEGGDAMSFWTLIFTISSLLISTISVLISIEISIFSKNTNINADVYMIIILVIYTVLMLVIVQKPARALLKFSNVYKWRKYILVAIDELEKQNSKGSKLLVYDFDIEIADKVIGNLKLKEEK